MVASFLNIRVHQNLIITGEITMEGKVLPVGGLQEKALAAISAHPGTTVNMIIPSGNVIGGRIISDWCHSPTTVGQKWLCLDKVQRQRLKVFAAETVFDVLELALIRDQGG